MKRTRIFVTVPHAAKEDICDKVIETLMIIREDERYAVNIEYPCNSPSEATRSMGLKAFLESEHDHWLQIDSDNPPACNPLDLVEYLEDKPIIGLPTPVHQHNGKGEPTLTWNAYKAQALGYSSIMPDGYEFEKVDAVGTGCIFIAGRVFHSQSMKIQPFQRVWKEDGTVQLGSDMAFCERAQHAGFEVWVHWGYRCNHFSIVNLAEMMQLQRDAWEAGRVSGRAAAGRLFSKQPGVLHVSRRAHCRTFQDEEGGPSFVEKVFTDDDQGQIAFANECMADSEFGELPWFNPRVGQGKNRLVCKLYPKESRLDKVAPTLSADRKLELAGEALSIILDMLIRGYAHRDFHAENLFLIDDQLKLLDFECLTRYPEEARPVFSACYDVTGEGLDSPWLSGNMCYSKDDSGSVSNVLGVNFKEAKSQLRDIIKARLREVSIDFNTNGGRHTCSQGKVYNSFSLPGFSVDGAQRDCAKRHERLGTIGQLYGKRVLDLGSNVGGMLLHAQQCFQPGECLGVEYDESKVMVANRVVAFCDLGGVRFIQGDIDKITTMSVNGPYDVVFCLAVDAHVKDRKRLYRLLGEVTDETLYFEGNANTDPSEVEVLLFKNGFKRFEHLGVCDDDSRPENNCRPLLRAFK